MYSCFSWSSTTIFLPLLQTSRLKIVVVFNTLYLERYSKLKEEPRNSVRDTSHSLPDINQCMGHLASCFLPLACIGRKPQDCKEGKNTDLSNPRHKTQTWGMKTHPQNSTLRITKQSLCQSSVKNILSLDKNTRAYRILSTIFTRVFSLTSFHFLSKYSTPSLP